jgi:hypothetical protein
VHRFLGVLVRSGSRLTSRTKNKVGNRETTLRDFPQGEGAVMQEECGFKGLMSILLAMAAEMNAAGSIHEMQDIGFFNRTINEVVQGCVGYRITDSSYFL